MRLLAPATYRRQPWKNGLGESVEIAAERDGDGEGWNGLVWSLSRTGFDRPSRFSDLTGIDRIITVVRGSGLTLRALDGGADIAVPPLVPTAFDGGRALEGIPDGPIEVVNLMGRQGRVRIGAAVLDDSATDLRIVADHALLYGFDDWVVFGGDIFIEPRWEFSADGNSVTHIEASPAMPPDHAVWLAGANVRAGVRRGRAFLATIDRQ